MRMHLSHNPKPRINLHRTTDKNPKDGLVKPMRELAKSLTEDCGKV